jgi:DNA-binding transcriptional regulator YhcF (GntR family)
VGINPDASDPRKYVQITKDLEAQMIAGVLKPGEVLTIARIAEEFGVAPQTARRALKVIEKKGLVACRRAVGHVVTYNGELGEIMRARKEEAARVSELSEKVSRGLDMLTEAADRLNKALASLNAKAAELARLTGQIETKPRNGMPLE